MVTRSIARKDVCSSCGADLRSCMNCAFHDPAASKQCREPIAEIVKDKAKANFCDFFAFAETSHPSGAVSEAERARKSLDDLFKKQVP